MSIPLSKLIVLSTIVASGYLHFAQASEIKENQINEDPKPKTYLSYSAFKDISTEQYIKACMPKLPKEQLQKVIQIYENLCKGVA